MKSLECHKDILKISVRVKTKAFKDLVLKKGNNSYEVYTTAMPIDGKANKRVLELLKDYFKTKGFRVQKIYILKGEKSKNKTIVLEYYK